MNNLDDLNSILKVPFTFKQRPVALPPDLRPDWQITIILLILYKCCRGKKSSITKLHMLSWALRTKANRQAFLNWVNGQLSPHKVIVRYDPSLYRAVDLALGEGLIVRSSKDRIEITKKGLSFISKVDELEIVLEEEKLFIDEIQAFVTEKGIDEIIEVVSSYDSTLMRITTSR